MMTIVFTCALAANALALTTNGVAEAAVDREAPRVRIGAVISTVEWAALRFRRLSAIICPS